MDMLTRMQTGCFKVFRHLNNWWEEFSLYHRKDGKVVKEDDDLMSATRYAIMMLRFASTKAAYDRFPQTNRISARRLVLSFECRGHRGEGGP
jgi:terminase large subunit-like protein